MSAFALSVSPMNIKAYGIAAIYPPLGSRTPYWRVSTPSSTGRSRALSSIWRISMKSPATPVWRLWRTGPSCWLCARTRTRCLTPSETRSRAQPDPKSRLIQPERTLAVPFHTILPSEAFGTEVFDSLTAPARQGLRRPRRWIIMEHTTVRSTLEVLVCKRAQAVSCFPSFPCRGPTASAPSALPPGASSTFWPRPGRSSGRFSPWFLPAAVIPLHVSILFRGQPFFLDLEELTREGLLTQKELDAARRADPDRVDLCLAAPDPHPPAAAGMGTRQGVLRPATGGIYGGGGRLAA